jgi:uncharacterized tellurite resistance protein B-like protein
MRTLQKLLGLEAKAEASDTATVRRIAAELERLPAHEARRLAAFAYVLARVARADLDVSSEEVAAMERLVAEQGGLSPPQAALVVQIAKSQAIAFGGTEDYVVTRQFRELSTREERIALVRCLFAVGAADDSISEAENSLVSVIGGELGLTGAEIAALRREFRDHLAVLKSNR